MTGLGQMKAITKALRTLGLGLVIVVILFPDVFLLGLNFDIAYRQRLSEKSQSLALRSSSAETFCQSNVSKVA